MNRTVVLAYSGGLDTSVCVRWLVERGYRVVAFMANVGQGDPQPVAIRRAKVAGASRVIVRDLRREFVLGYIWPSLKAHAVYEGKYLLATALSRPLIAAHLVDVAHQVGAQAVAHGCTGKGNDQVRFEVTARILDPSLQMIAPVREWEFRSRDDEIEYAKRHRIPIDVTKRSPYSIDQNLWGTSIEAGVLEDPWTAPPADTYRSIRSPERAASQPASITVGFSRGVPTALNGARLDPIRLITRVNALGAQHGVGRTDMIESRVVGIKSREVYESPAGTILLEAHRELERVVLDRELLHFKESLAGRYAELVYGGLWHTPLKAALDAFVNETQRRVTGTVRLKLFRGACHVTGRRSPHSLYRERLATYSAKDQFDQRAAEGFIKLWGLPYEGAGGRGMKQARSLKNKKMWGGRFTKKTDPLVERYTSSLAVDHRLAAYDVIGSIAHAKMLGACKIIPQQEAGQLMRGLERIGRLIEQGKFKPDPTAEDIHSQIEAMLQAMVGAVAGTLHTARSRNDQVALDLRLYCRDVTTDIGKRMAKVQRTLLTLASDHRDVVIPGYTHLQKAQPVLISHHLLAYVEMLGRDRDRVAECRARVNVLPLGAGALAGTSLPIDRRIVAKLLRFPRIADNSLDAVSDRDFAVELMTALALMAVHLSRLAEDLILWVTEEFGIAELDEAFATGSSLMPQKKNPDVLELIRGQAGLVIGGSVAMFTMLKGLPLAYNRDLQWDKTVLFQAVDLTQASLDVLERCLRHLRIRRDRIERLLESEAMCATDVADYLVQRGVPFRQAHEIVGKVVAAAERRGRRLSELRVAELKQFSPHFDEEARSLFNPRRSVELKLSLGGTSPQGVSQAIDRWKKRLRS